MTLHHLGPAGDPFDLWATPLGVAIRERFYAGKFSGKAGAVAMGLAEWWLPTVSRFVFGTPQRIYAQCVALEILTGELTQNPSDGETPCAEPSRTRSETLEILSSLAVARGLPDGAAGWGHGFPWMSKNGLYAPDTPLVTTTPYVMEALLVLAKDDACHEPSMALFHATWGFLEALRVMARDGDQLALSYAPKQEPRIVVNANAYAALAYALHAVNGVPDIRGSARNKAAGIVRWIVARQEPDGRWFYYADDLPGNFIDGFHTGFVLKNLRKTAALLPELSALLQEPLARGWAFLRERFYDGQAGLCRRFIVRDIRDPYRWDLYDQAEYLGQLVDLGQWDEAGRFRDGVRLRFRRGRDWYCRIDWLGRRWGRNFLRWGIAPFLHHSARLDAALRRVGKTL